MSEYYFSTQIDANTVLCIAPISDRRIELSEDEVSDASGYFLYETKGGGEPDQVRILAQISSEEAVFALKDMLGLK